MSGFEPGGVELDGIEINGSDGGSAGLFIYPALFDASAAPPGAGGGTIGSVLDAMFLVGLTSLGVSDIAYVPAVPDFTTVAAVPDTVAVPPGRKP